MRTTGPTCAALAVLLATVAGCAGEEPSAAVVRDTPTYTRAVGYVVAATHGYRDDGGAGGWPPDMVQDGDDYVLGSQVDVSANLNPTAAAAPGVRLGWYVDQGTSYDYCLETDDTHYTVVGAGSGQDRDEDQVAEDGPCPAEVDPG